MLRFLTSNLMIKLWIGAAVVGSIVYGVEGQTGGSQPCSRVEYYPNKSAVYQCPAGLSTVSLRNPYKIPIFTTITTDVQTKAWLTTPGDDQTENTLLAGKLGAASILDRGAFMAIGDGKGLVYVLGSKRFMLSVAWDVKTHH